MPIQKIWTFKTRDYEVVCEAVEPAFIDPLVHDQEIIDAVERGEAMLTHLAAQVYRRGVKIGEARLLDCIHGSELIPEDSLWRLVFDSWIVRDHSYRRKVARWAINDARKTLGDLLDDLPDVYLRKVD